MRLPIVILAVLGLAYGKSLPTRNLNDDLNDFLALVPQDKVIGITLDYLANDREVQELVLYLQSEEFHKIVRTVEDLEEFRQLIKIPEELGIDVNSIINLIHEIIGLPPYAVHKNTRRGVGLNGLIDDLIEVLPVDKLRALFEEKLVSSPDFRRLIEAIRSPEFKRILDKLESLPEFQRLLQDLRDKGVEVDRIIELLKALFGLSRRGIRNLNDDLNDFLALVPLECVIPTLLDYLANDREVQDLVLYLQSEEFHKIVRTVEDLEEFRQLINIPEELGIDVNSIINLIHEIIGLPPYAARKNTRRGVGVTGLIDDLLVCIPVDKLRALFEEKLVSSPDFRRLIEAIRSPEFTRILDTLESLPEFQRLLQDLRDKGVEVDRIIELLKDLFGLSRRGVRNLNDDLNDFLALVPLDQVIGILLDYLANDQEVQELVLYLQSEEFHKIVRTVEDLEEFRQLIKIPEELGIDVNSIINLIHEVIGLPPYAVRKNTRRGVGVNGLIDDLRAVLPVDKLRALFEEKLVSSPDFRRLIEAIRSPEFRRILDTLENLPEFQRLLQDLRDKGVEVDDIIKLLKDLFGLSRRGIRNLNDDLNDFLALVPLDQVIGILLDYLANDQEVQELVLYLQSEEFHKIVRTVEDLEEFRQLIQIPEELGIDVNSIINLIHEVIGLPPYAARKNTRRGVGVNGLIDDLLAVLPVDKLRALFEEKLVSSPDFRRLIEAIRSPEFRRILDTLEELPEFQRLLQDLQDKGVDVHRIIDFLKALFGLSRRGIRNLNDDLNDFLALVPLDQVIGILLDYLANDQEVQELVLYLQSEEFHKIVRIVEDLEEFRQLIKIPEELGIDVNSIINLIHEIIGLPPYAVRKNTRRGVGVNGLIDDLLAVLPVDKLRALFEEKLVSSPDFRRLIEAIRSPEFRRILDTLESLPEFQRLLQDLRDKKVDVDGIIEFLKDLFGLSRRGIRNLNDDLNDFLALVPLDQVIGILLDYLANDQEVQELVLYLQSEEFHKIVRTVEDLEEFRQLIKIPEELGIDVNSVINLIHEIIGLPPYAVRKNTRRGVGVNGLIDDLLAALPVDKLRALFEEKLVSSPDFRRLIEAIQSPEFKRILDTLEELPEFQRLLQDLRDKKVDVDRIIELLKALFGLSH